MENRKKVIVHINNLAPEVLAALTEKYPEGYRNHIFKVTKPNNDFFHAVTIDMGNTSYLIKVDVKIDTVNHDKLDEQIFSGLENIEPDIKESESDEDEKKSKKADDDDY